ncbi:nitrate regulatory gene2 protein-like [Senna tora]|uniref:Nitrate regulatory gene2 protein-like n=1 Tax=Senna tora TaxID=362788 RepID=A0A835CIU6_9FABA|nr:nitrate regulatory gene2 protein-like [Senna tora]
MGCISSKLNDLPVVSLCRQRCAFLDEAIHLRYALSAAHISYINSLQSISLSLHHFLQFHFTPSPPPSPPPSHNPQPVIASASASTVEPVDASHSPSQLSHINYGSHLQFRSKFNEEDDDDNLHLPSLNYFGHSSIFSSNFPSNQQGLASFLGDGYMHMNYMQNEATPSIGYEQRPPSPRTVYMGESSSFYPYPYSNYNPIPYYPYYGYQTYGGGGSEFYGPPPPYWSEPPVDTSSTKLPSPPRSSGSDFLNFFYNEYKYYSQQQYIPSQDLDEVRKEEGIPDLEDDDSQPEEEVEPVHGDQNVADDGIGDHSASSKDYQEIKKETSPNQTRPSTVSMENERVEVKYENEGVEVQSEPHVVHKDVTDGDERSGEQGSPRDALEVAIEIAIQFWKASESSAEVAKMLEVGTLPYHRKHSAYQVAPSLSMVSQPSAFKSAKTTSTLITGGPANLDFDEDLLARSRNLSSILYKLHLWEKKLYNEVKMILCAINVVMFFPWVFILIIIIIFHFQEEEKIRLMHDRKCRKLKRLQLKGADFHKLDSTRTLIKNLSAKMRMAIEVIDKVSTAINKIRDEELWPQLNELIQRLMRMWKSMLECHRSQCEAIREANILGSIGSRKKNCDAHLASKKLEQELINWTFQFSNWVSAQKGYVKALNNWLTKCLLYEPEETPDGTVVPSSPGSIGAPPIFVICNKWSQAMEQMSEKEVIDSMQVFAMSVLQIWEQDRLEMHQQVTTNRYPERNIEREGHELQKLIQALQRKMVLAFGEAAGSLSISENIISDGDKGNSLHDSLQGILEAMERFTDRSARMYEELIDATK